MNVTVFDMLLKIVSFEEIHEGFSLPVTTNLQVFLISNFRRVLNVVCFLLGDSPASEFYIPTFRNTVHFIFIGAPT